MAGAATGTCGNLPNFNASYPDDRSNQLSLLLLISVRQVARANEDASASIFSENSKASKTMNTFPFFKLSLTKVKNISTRDNLVCPDLIFCVFFCLIRRSLPRLRLVTPVLVRTEKL
jgi:hypothetical protein